MPLKSFFNLLSTRPTHLYQENCVTFKMKSAIGGNIDHGFRQWFEKLKIKFS